jgi:Fe2+ or Zn2+ uptake regulation protein
MNYSKQREAIIAVLKDTSCHPTADWVYKEVRKTIPNISLGTVYRNLKQLENHGEIIRVHGTFEKERFDGNPQNHAHFVCEKCGDVSDFQIPYMVTNDIMKISPNTTNFSLNLTGVCDRCKRKG